MSRRGRAAAAADRSVFWGGRRYAELVTTAAAGGRGRGGGGGRVAVLLCAGWGKGGGGGRRVANVPGACGTAAHAAVGIAASDRVVRVSVTVLRDTSRDKLRHRKQRGGWSKFLCPVTHIKPIGYCSVATEHRFFG